MDNSSNLNSRTRGPRRNRRRLSNLRPPSLSNPRPPLLPNPRPPMLQNLRVSLLRNPEYPISNFRVQREDWHNSPENWALPSEFWHPYSTQYWPPPAENWSPLTENLDPLTEDRRSVLASNSGQSLLAMLNRTNNRADNAVPSTSSASVTYRLNEVQLGDASDPDVEYLYSVDTSAEGHIAEVVDLTVNSEISTNLTEPNSSQPVSTEPQPEKRIKTRKRKMSDSHVNTEKRQRQNHSQPCCSFCQANYDELRERNQSMCVARCGHTFCYPCTSAKSANKVCNICKRVIGSLYKIFL